MTVGFGFAPNLLTFRLAAKALAGSPDTYLNTAGGDLHPALRNKLEK